MNNDSFYLLKLDIMKKLIPISILSLGLIFLAGCSLQTTITTPGTGEQTTGQVIVQPAKMLSYLISTESPSTYCNGTIMDSDGYKKTITKEVVTSASIDGMTTAELAKATIVIATTGQCQTVLQENNLTVSGDTVTIAPINGWAGISIAMCSCKPQIEVNLLRIDGIKKVVYK